jgi:hypothetical protein
MKREKYKKELYYLQHLSPRNEKLLAFDRDIVCKSGQICYEKGLIKK